MTPQKIASDTLALLDERGWVQHTGFGPGGQVCMGSALFQAKDKNVTPQPPGVPYYSYHLPSDVYWETIIRIAALVHELFPGRCGQVFRIPDFNDHPDTTEEDVRLVLKTLAGS
jgi:hypothetical protein